MDVYGTLPDTYIFIVSGLCKVTWKWMSSGPTLDAVGGSTFHCDYVDFGWNENERMDWGIELDPSC